MKSIRKENAFGTGKVFEIELRKVLVQKEFFRKEKFSLFLLLFSREFERRFTREKTNEGIYLKLIM